MPPPGNKAGQVCPVAVEGAYGYVLERTVPLTNVPAVHAMLSLLRVAG